MHDIGQTFSSSYEIGTFDLGLIQDFETIRISEGRWQLARTPTHTEGANTDLVVASGGTLRIETPLLIPGNYSHEAPLAPDDPKARVEMVVSSDGPGVEEALLQLDGNAELSGGELEIELAPPQASQRLQVKATADVVGLPKVSQSTFL